METLNLYQKLLLVQNELKAPKSQRNSFGNYNYRSAEDILEAVKPVCQKYDCVIKVSDDIVLIGERYYIKASARFYNSAGDFEESIAFAREPETKKGMDESQITGTASSYARKYALNGLLCIDDNKDADTDEHVKETKPELRLISKEQTELIQQLMPQERITKMLEYYKVDSINKLSLEQASETIVKLRTEKKEKK
jgi:hypothetical protein